MKEQCRSHSNLLYLDTSNIYRTHNGFFFFCLSGKFRSKEERRIDVHHISVKVFGVSPRWYSCSEAFDILRLILESPPGRYRLSFSSFGYSRWYHPQFLLVGVNRFFEFLLLNNLSEFIVPFPLVFSVMLRPGKNLSPGYTLY